jgi:hypothetical protein
VVIRETMTALFAMIRSSTFRPPGGMA